MSRIRSKNTKPELVIRSLLHVMGYRFRLHRKDLPGTPDITLPKYRTVIFIQGCFWHYHKNCRDGKIPKTNKKYWKPKLLKNAAKDRRNIAALKKLGWNVITVWECEIEKNPNKVLTKIQKLLK